MKTQIINAANSDYTGNKTDLTVDIQGNKASWSYNEYDFTIEVTVDQDRSKFDIKRDECWINYELNGNEWSETLHNGHACLSGYSSMTENELVCAVVRKAHSWICNRV